MPTKAQGHTVPHWKALCSNKCEPLYMGLDLTVSDLGASGVTIVAPAILLQGSCPQAIFKFLCLTTLDYIFNPSIQVSILICKRDRTCDVQLPSVDLQYSMPERFWH